MRELMPFVKGKKLYDETGSDLTPTPGPEGTRITGDMAYDMFDQVSGNTPENRVKLVLEAVQSSTPKQFIAKYGQEQFNLAASMLEDSGVGKAIKDKTGNVTSFKMSGPNQTVKTVGGFTF